MQEINNTQEERVQPTEIDIEITQVLNVSGSKVNLTTINVLVYHGKDEKYEWEGNFQKSDRNYKKLNGMLQ